jgi:ComF family protein
MHLARELLFPSFCYLCREPAHEGMPLCPECLSKIELIQNRCQICGEPFSGEAGERSCGDCMQDPPHFVKARAWARFGGPMLDVIHKFKYQRGFQFAEWMAAGMIEVFEKEFADQEVDLIVPVPLHWRRLLSRGYNQALILARPISRKLKIPIAAGVLARAVNNPSQVGLSRPKRKENLKKVFQVESKSKVAGKNILLIDDVITTGATVDEVARVLRKAGAESVCVLAFARA